MDKAVARTSRMPIWVCAIVGALIGLTGGVNFVVAVTLGFVLGYVLYIRNLALSENVHLQSRIGALLERVSLLEYAVKRLRMEPEAVAEAAPGASIETPPSVSTEAARLEASLRVPEPQQQVPIKTPVTPASAPQAHVPWTHPNAIARARVVPAQESDPSFFDKAIGAAKAWLFGGNTVARVGLLVLFVGVAFLLRYVAERTQIPIELRLVGVALLLVGWLGTQTP
ncbi:MAG: hypothetical protein ABI580_09605, partial [Burkholderiaceae bacterium]